MVQKCQSLKTVGPPAKIIGDVQMPSLLSWRPSEAFIETGIAIFLMVEDSRSTAALGHFSPYRSGRTTTEVEGRPDARDGKADIAAVKSAA
jgi:hypothetical protein